MKRTENVGLKFVQAKYLAYYCLELAERPNLIQDPSAYTAGCDEDKQDKLLEGRGDPQAWTVAAVDELLPSL